MQSLNLNDDLPAIGTNAANEMSPHATPMKNDDDDELFKSLKLVRLKMKTGSHKHSVFSSSTPSTSSTFTELTNAVLLPPLDDDNGEQPEDRSTSPVPTRYDVQLTVPPLRPHNQSWLEDDVPSFLEAGPAFHEDVVKEESCPKKGKSSKASTESKPSQVQLAQAFEALSHKSTSNTRRVYTREGLFAPFLVEPPQQHEVNLSLATKTGGAAPGKSVPPAFEALARAASISPQLSPTFQKRSKYAQSA